MVLSVGYRSPDEFFRRTVHKKIQTGIILFAFTTLASCAVANNFADALQAFDSGDFKKAHKLWLIEAEKGDAASQVKLGIMYNLGKGVPQDYQESVKWLRLAVEQGDAHAQYNLGLMYLNGYGVNQSYADAYAWWVVASANGSESARGNMKAAQGGQMTPKQIEKGQQLAKQLWARFGN